MTSISPQPTANSGPNSTQTNFQTDYYASKSPAFQPLYWNRPGVPLPAGMTELTQDQMYDLAGKLIAMGYTVDEEIDVQGWPPYMTMWMRKYIYGQTWEPAGLGKTNVVDISQPGAVVTAGMYTGPVPNGQIKVSVDPADYPAFQIPPDNAPVVPPSPKLKNPVGILRIQFNPAKLAIGDMYQRNVDATGNDGYSVGDFWPDAASVGQVGNLVGQWQKQLVFMGMAIYWVRTQ